MNAPVPAKYKILASLAPMLFLVAIISTSFYWKNRVERSRLAREKRGAVLALPHLEQAREILERTERYLRLPGLDDKRRDEVRDFAQLALDSAERSLEFAPVSEEAHRLQHPGGFRDAHRKWSLDHDRQPCFEGRHCVSATQRDGAGNDRRVGLSIG